MSLTGPEEKCSYKKEFLEKEKTKREKLQRNFYMVVHFKVFLRNFETVRSKRYLHPSKNQPHILIGFFTEQCRLKKHVLRMGVSNLWVQIMWRGRRNSCTSSQECFGVVNKMKVFFGLGTYRSRKSATLKPLRQQNFIRSLELTGTVREHNRPHGRSEM